MIPFFTSYILHILYIGIKVCVNDPFLTSNMCHESFRHLWHAAFICHTSHYYVTPDTSIYAHTHETYTKNAIAKHTYTTDGVDRTWNNYDCQNFQQVCTGVPVRANFDTSFHVCERSPRHSKDLSGETIDVEILIFKVWSPPWRHIDIYLCERALLIGSSYKNLMRFHILCNALQHTATHCNTLQHAATRCNTLQHAAAHYNHIKCQFHVPTYCRIAVAKKLIFFWFFRKNRITLYCGSIYADNILHRKGLLTNSLQTWAFCHELSCVWSGS